MASDLSDDLLKRIRDGSGRVYTHEAKAMAAEIIRWREAAKKAAAGTAPGSVGQPYPFHP